MVSNNLVTVSKIVKAVKSSTEGYINILKKTIISVYLIYITFIEGVVDKLFNVNVFLCDVSCRVFRGFYFSKCLDLLFRQILCVCATINNIYYSIYGYLYFINFASSEINLNKKNMSIKRTDSTPRMSRIVEHGNTIYLCGQTAKDANTDIKEQTRTTLEKVEELLAKVDSDKKNILSVTIYVRDMKDFAAMNEVWDAWVVEGHQPARACVEARMARPELLVEMSVVAAKIV